MATLAESIKSLDSLLMNPNSLYNPVETALLQDIPLCLRGAFLLDTTIYPLVRFSEICAATAPASKVAESTCAYLNDLLTHLGLGSEEFCPVTHLQRISENDLAEANGWYDLMNPDESKQSIAKRRIRKSKALKTFIANIAKLLAIVTDSIDKSPTEVLKGLYLLSAANRNWHIAHKSLEGLFFTSIILWEPPLSLHNMDAERLYERGKEFVQARWLDVLNIIGKENVTVNMPAVWNALTTSETVQAFLKEAPLRALLGDLQDQYQQQFSKNPEEYIKRRMERDLPPGKNVHHQFMSAFLEDIPSLQTNPFLDFSFAENDPRKQQSVNRKKGTRFGCPLKILASSIDDADEHFRNFIRLAQAEDGNRLPDYTSLQKLLEPLSIATESIPSPSDLIKFAVLREYLESSPLPKDFTLPDEETIRKIIESAYQFIEDMTTASFHVQVSEELHSYFLHLNNSLFNDIPDEKATIGLFLCFEEHLQKIHHCFNDALFARETLRIREIEFNRYLSSLKKKEFKIPSVLTIKELIKSYWKFIRERDSTSYKNNKVLQQEYLEIHVKDFLQQFQIPKDICEAFLKKKSVNSKAMLFLSKRIASSNNFLYHNIPNKELINNLIDECSSFISSSLKENINKNILVRILTCFFIDPKTCSYAFERNPISLDALSRKLFLIDYYLSDEIRNNIPSFIRIKIRSHQEKENYVMFSLNYFWDTDNNRVAHVENITIPQWRRYFRYICDIYSSEKIATTSYKEYYSRCFDNTKNKMNDVIQKCFKLFLKHIKEIELERLELEFHYVSPYIENKHYILDYSSHPSP